MNEQPALYAVKPVLVERACGGWIAMTPRGWPLSIGVTAPTQERAVCEFEHAMERWAKIGEE
jgi:hypothetical protein